MKTQVLYDDACPMCTFQMRLLTWMDWFKVVDLLPLSSPKTEEIAPHLTREDLREAIHCITPKQVTHRGARCLRYVGLRMPLLIPMALFLWIPGIIFIAERFYNWIARNRYVISKVFGCKDACAIMPSRAKTENGEEAVPLNDAK